MNIARKVPESSVTDDIIRRIHLTLANLRTGEEILSFLRSTEPVFMEEVSRFIRTEMSRMRYQLSETQALYVGSVIGATYIAGFLIAREANHLLLNNVFATKSDIKEALTPAEIEKIIDQKLNEGRNYKEISRAIRNMIEKDKKNPVSKKKPEPKIDRGKRLDLGNLD